MITPGLIIGAIFVTLFLSIVICGLLAAASNAIDEGSALGAWLFGGAALAIAYFLVLNILSCGG